ncbi:MAG: methyltransferase domain-containing protein [Candidatus Brocadiae bacterium]|nr:methyltransferase domain-containing protein [Candidatus Brocadiia bacterium]
MKEILSAAENFLYENKGLELSCPILVCPFCQKELIACYNSLSCKRCELCYPIQHGIMDFLLEKECYWVSGAFSHESKNYEQRYQSLEKAKNYNLQKKKEATLSEGKIIEKLLEAQGKTKFLLDVPCGGGRLSYFLEKNTQYLIEADIAYGQLLYGQKNFQSAIPKIYLRTSALRLPLKDNSIDAAVCIRLSHHLHSEQERILLIRELLRVSSRFVILSFNDSYAFKNIYRGWKKRLEKNTMSMDEIARIANDFHADLLCAPNTGFMRTHRYALLIKRENSNIILKEE